MEDCCATRPNFGRPICVDDFGTITSMILVPLRDSLGNKYVFDIRLLTYEVIYDFFFATNPADRLYGFPQLENVEYAIADSLKEEGASGRKSHLRDGIISITAESWDKDGTAVIKGKMAQLRCADWGVLYVTDKNLIVGSFASSVPNALGGESGYLLPIKIDSQSVDPKFMFKTNTTTQKVMLTFDLDRNFDDATYYAVGGDELWSSTDSAVKSIDFNDVPKVIDCNLTLNGAVLPAGFNIIVNDDYRDGARNVNNTELGNVTGLLAANFLITNITDATTVTPTSVTEQSDGNYAFVVPAQTVTDKIKVELVIDAVNAVNYNGSITFVI